MTSDRERWSLRGPVHTCRVERTWHGLRCGTEACEPEVSGDSSLVEFRPDGSLARRWHKNPDGSEWTSTQEYDVSGRLLVIKTESPGGQANLEIYEYDDARRLTRRIVRADGRERVVENYEYPTEGRKTKIFHVDAQGPTINAWGVEGAVGHFSAPGAATISTMYQHDNPVELLFHDAAGTLLSRVDFRYGEAGHLVEEAQSNLVFPFSSETPDKMNAAQLKTIRSVFGGDGNPLRHTHRYDEQGNRTESVFEWGPLGRHRRLWTYNSHGDPVTEIDEHEHREFGISEAGQLSETPTKETSTRSEARFHYQYDGRGNWTEKIVEGRGSEGQEFRVTGTERRLLAYYDNCLWPCVS